LSRQRSTYVYILMNR